MRVSLILVPVEADSSWFVFASAHGNKNFVIKSDRNPIEVLTDLIPVDGVATPAGRNVVKPRGGSSTNSKKKASGSPTKQKESSVSRKNGGTEQNQPRKTPEVKASKSEVTSPVKSSKPERSGQKAEVNSKTGSKPRKLRPCSNCGKMEAEPRLYKKCQRCVQFLAAVVPYSRFKQEPKQFSSFPGAKLKV